MACSLTDVLSLLPSPNDPFILGPRDYLTQFLGLLSTLRNGDSRFLPLLLQKVHDVLPRLASPMLQNVPEPNPHAQNCGVDPNVDIFDGFGNAGMGVPTTLPQHFDAKTLENLGSSSSGDNCSDSSPFTSPPVMNPGMEFPGMNNFGGFPDLASPMDRPGSMNSQRQLPRGPPIRQNSNSSAFNVIPRSVPDGQPIQYHHLQGQGGELEHMMGIGETNMLRQREQHQSHGQHQSIDHSHQQHQMGLSLNMSNDGMGDLAYR